VRAEPTRLRAISGGTGAAVTESNSASSKVRSS
jgi:hypothetical protein